MLLPWLGKAQGRPRVGGQVKRELGVGCNVQNYALPSKDVVGMGELTALLDWEGPVGWRLPSCSSLFPANPVNAVSQKPFMHYAGHSYPDNKNLPSPVVAFLHLLRALGSLA